MLGNLPPAATFHLHPSLLTPLIHHANFLAKHTFVTSLTSFISFFSKTKKKQVLFLTTNNNMEEILVSSFLSSSHSCH